MWTPKGKCLLPKPFFFMGLLLMLTSAMPETAVAGGDGPLQLTLEVMPPLQIVGQPITLAVHFKNQSKTPVSLLKAFDPIPVFFSVNITDRVSDRPIDVPGAGKVDFSGKPDVEILKPNQEYVVQMDVGKLLGPGRMLKRGLYDIAITYHNQYGEDVVKGNISSDTVRLRVLDRDE